MTDKIHKLVAGSEGMAELMQETAGELVGCTENSPEEARLKRIADAVDAYTAARDELARDVA